LKKILLVCSGNTCRSPLAEVIARQVFAGMSDPAIEVASAGTSAMEGSPASRNSVEVAGMHGLDLGGHRASLLDRRRVREADLILTMGERHRETVAAIDPGASEYTFLLTSFSDRHRGDIPDPIGGPLQVYVSTYGVIRECIEALAEQIKTFDGWKSPSTGRKGSRW
jgi:protein-tyrosine-phosphatase